MCTRVFLPAIASGALLWTAFFPLNLGPVAFIALVPFLTLVHTDGIGPWRRYFAAFLGGIAFFALALNWVRVAHPMMALFAWPGLTIACALFWVLALFLMRKLDRFGLPLAVIAPVVWVALDYARTHFPTGYPMLQYVHAYQLAGFGWYSLGYAQHSNILLLQAADLGGVDLLSLGIAAVNGAIYDWFIRSPLVRRLLRWPVLVPRQPFTREAITTAVAISLPLLCICYGTIRLAHPPFTPGPRVAALQGNLSQDEKIIRGDQRTDVETETPLDREYRHLAEKAGLGTAENPAPDLVIWPETCWSENWYEALPGTADDPEIPQFRQKVEYLRHKVGFEAAALTHTNSLLGLNTQEWDGTKWKKYNSAVLIRPTGAFAGRYDKIHLVPFGEYVPLKEQLPFLQMLTPYKHDYSCTPGENWTRFELPTKDRGTFKFGVLICYEDSDPTLARRYNSASGNANTDFLVNISNDGWFDGTEEHEQHLAVCRFRAVEWRQSIVRAVNMGISAVIDPDGRIVELPSGDKDDWSKSKKTRGIVRAEVPIDHRESLYAAFGDWVGTGCWLLVFAGLIARRFVSAQRLEAAHGA